MPVSKTYQTPVSVDPVVIGVDPSTKTGIAIVKAVQGVPQVVHLSTITFPKLNELPRLMAFEAQMQQLCEEFSPTFALMEGYGFKNKFTLVPLVEVGTIIRRVLYRKNVQIGLFSPKSLKSYTVGNGNASKEQMIDAVGQRWGLTTKDNNQADAIALAMAGWNYLANNCNSAAERRVLHLITLLQSGNVITPSNSITRRVP